MIKEGACYVVDVRTAPEFESHRIAGAYLLPIQELRERHGEIPQDCDRAILICCEHGVRSVNACAGLSRNGWSKLMNLTGGMAQWVEEGLPFVSGLAKDEVDLAPPKG